MPETGGLKGEMAPGECPPFTWRFFIALNFL